MLHVVLYQPEIPHNTGAIGRLCLATGARLHLIHPLGFSLDDRQLKRAGLDYWKDVDVVEWPTWEAYCASLSEGAKLCLLTTKATEPYWRASLTGEDVHLVLGPETRGLPQSMLNEYANQCWRIPMQPLARSLNLATAAGIVMYEAVRQMEMSASHVSIS
jgi:tRNA (cytidine/uridine-2'-O-)-methyltransferase